MMTLLTSDFEAFQTLSVYVLIAVYESISGKPSIDNWAGDDRFQNRTDPVGWVKANKGTYQSPTAIANLLHSTYWEICKQLEILGLVYREGMKWFPTEKAAALCQYSGKQLRWDPIVVLDIQKLLDEQREKAWIMWEKLPDGER